MCRSSRSRMALAYSLRLRRCASGRPGIGRRPARRDRACVSRNETSAVCAGAGGRGTPGRRHHPAAHLADHLLPHVARARPASLRLTPSSAQPAGLQTLVVAGDAVGVDGGLQIGRSGGGSRRRRRRLRRGFRRTGARRWAVQATLGRHGGTWKRRNRPRAIFSPFAATAASPDRAATTQIEFSVRPGAGTGNPRASISLRMQRRRLGTLDRRLHADAHEPVGVVDRLERDAGDGRARDVRVAAAAVAHLELRAALDEQLDHVGTALQRRAHQRGAPFVVRVVRVETEVQQHLHGLEVVGRRPLVGDTVHPADAAGRGERRVAVGGHRLRIGAVLQQQLHQRDVARLAGADERRGAVLEEPLHREDGARQRVVLHLAFGLAPLASSGLISSR